VLDGLFGFNWNFEIVTPEIDGFTMAEKTGFCVVRGRLTGKVKVDGKYIEIIKEQYGRAEVKFTGQGADRKPLDFGNDMKAAASDALKKCASLLGIAADVYDPEEFMPIEVEGSDEANQRAKNAQRLTQEAKRKTKLMDAPGTEVENKPKTIQPMEGK